METAGYVTLSRQSGLLREMQIIANNIANSATTGFRREGMVFSEFVVRADQGPSVSVAYGNGRNINLLPAELSPTGGAFDLAIEGDGFFLVATPNGERLTRAGAFTPSADGVLVTLDGYPLLDAGGAPVPAPVAARQVSISTDGNLSADGQPVAQIGLWQPTDPVSLRHEAGTLFSASGWEPLDQGKIRQGFLEGSNVDPLSEVARMIEVQRAYELGQKFLEAEDQRQKGVVQTLGR